MPKKPNKGGYHPVDCTCGKRGCWSCRPWLTEWVEKHRKSGKPLPTNVPEKFRNLVFQNAAGETTMEVKDGQVPSMSEQVEGVLKRKPLPMPSDVRQKTVVTEQVPVAVQLPWAMIGETVNKQLPPDAPPGARIDTSKEQERILNEDVANAFPGLMVGPKTKLVIDVVLWTLPAWLFWVPRWLKGKFKNFKWPWSKKEEKKPEEQPKPGEPVPEAKP